MDQPMDERDVVIGADVWLGARVVVGAGVEIGEGSVVAAHSFVTRSIPPGSIAGGNPARIIGRRGDQKAEAEVREARCPAGGLRQGDFWLVRRALIIL